MSQKRHALKQEGGSETNQMKQETSRSGSFISRCGPEGTDATAEGKKGIHSHRQSINAMHAQVHIAATKGNKYSVSEIDEKGFLKRLKQNSEDQQKRREHASHGAS